MNLKVYQTFLRCIPSLKYRLNNQNSLVLKHSCLKQQQLQSKECVEYLPVARSFHTNQILQKYKKTTAAEEVDSDEEDKQTEFKDERDSKVIRTKLNSLRADLILKAGLGMARNKIEAIFYDSKIRVNGKKLLKKSVQLHVGDEIDVVKGFSENNPSLINVARVIILTADEKEEGIKVNLRRYKTLLIENYPGPNAFKSSASQEH